MEPILAIDIGTTKICAILGRRDKDGPKVLAVASGPSSGIDKGLVVDVEEASRAVSTVVGEVSKKTGISLGRAHVAIGPNHVSSFNSSGRVTIIAADKVVTAVDRQAAVDDAIRKATVTPDRLLIQAIPIDYTVDGDVCVIDPVGLATTSLEARVHVITGLSTSVANVLEVMRRAGLDVDGIVLQPIASARGVLASDERSGVLVADIGGGTTGMAVLRDGGATHTGIFPVGGNHISRDIAVGLKIQIDEAEGTKKEFGCALGDMADDMDFINIGSEAQERIISKRYVCQIIEARLDEILKFLKGEIEGIVDREPTLIMLTGGSSQFEGIEELASRVFNLPVRVGRPVKVAGLPKDKRTPAYASAIGLLLYSFAGKSSEVGRVSLPPTAAAELFARLKGWLAERTSKS